MEERKSLISLDTVSELVFSDHIHCYLSFQKVITGSSSHMTYNWKKAVVSPDILIQEVLGVIDRESLRIALVSDDSGTLLGTVTDGDIRRYLMQSTDLNVPIRKIMNSEPVVVHENVLADEVKTLMESHNLLSIPVVDDAGILVALKMFQDLHSPQLRENPIFVMAGGFGTRLGDLTKNCPKPMLKVGNRPILETILHSFLANGFFNFYFSTHFLPEVIRDHFGDGSRFGCSITYIHEDEPLGTGGALGLLPVDLPDLPVIMINGDILTKVDFVSLLEFHERHGGLATMCVRQHQQLIPYGVIESEGDLITGVIEKPTKSYFVNAGIYVFSPKLRHSVAKGMKVDMPPLLMDQKKKGEDIFLFPVHEYWLDVGHIPDFEKAQVDFG